MIEILKILVNEHKNILKIIDALSEECQSLNSKDKDIDKKFFDQVVDFTINYADKFHHAKEEDILFVEMEKQSTEMPCNPIPQMLQEHDLGRDFIKEMKEGVKSQDKDKIIQNAQGYIELLREHIYKEDNILYPMANESLSSETQTKILKKFQQVEKENFIQGSKEKYITLVDELTKRK